MCLYPRLIKNRKYTSNKKNGGNIPPILDERVKFVPVGCQRCIECRKQKARGWQLRLLEDIKTNKDGKFITLTFSNEEIVKLTEGEHKDKFKGIWGYALDNQIATVAVRLFLERWRKKYGKSLRHWLVTELGHNGTENIHLHGIVWCQSPEMWKEIEKIWEYGFVWKGKGEKQENYVNERTVNYIIKYVHKVDEKHPLYQSKILTSAGIGNNYANTRDSKANKYKEKETLETYRTRQGFKIAMPPYWRNKIYTEEEREKLWLQRLDKNERWVCGEKVAADNEEDYKGLLEFYREKNIKLGYGNDEKTWDQEVYENQRRAMLMEKRKAKAKAIENKKKPASGTAPAEGG